jgi:hypothetical protein
MDGPRSRAALTAWASHFSALSTRVGQLALYAIQCPRMRKFSLVTSSSAKNRLVVAGKRSARGRHARLDLIHRKRPSRLARIVREAVLDNHRLISRRELNHVIITA